MLSLNLKRWLDSDHAFDQQAVSSRKIHFVDCLPFIAMHVACFGVWFTGYSATAIGVALALYALRVFAVGAFYHRYFAHRAFKTSRWMQCVFALCGLLAVQRGPLWWAAHHRAHHAYSDQPQDSHSPVQHGFWYSHLGWFLTREHFNYDSQRIYDWMRFPELRWLNRYDWVVPILSWVALYAAGQWLAHHYPQLKTNGWQLLVWGGMISTVAVYHVTFTVNSLAHCWGKRPYQTSDYSRNNGWLALLTFGEGWHNNHHYFPNTVRQGFRWYQIDITYYLLYAMSRLGLIWDLKTEVPSENQFEN